MRLFQKTNKNNNNNNKAKAETKQQRNGRSKMIRTQFHTASASAGVTGMCHRPGLYMVSNGMLEKGQYDFEPFKKHFMGLER